MLLVFFLLFSSSSINLKLIDSFALTWSTAWLKAYTYLKKSTDWNKKILCSTCHKNFTSPESLFLAFIKTTFFSLSTPKFLLITIHTSISFINLIIFALIVTSQISSTVWTWVRCILARINTIWNQTTTTPTSNKANQTRKQMRFHGWLILDTCCDLSPARRARHHCSVGTQACGLNNHSR